MKRKIDHECSKEIEGAVLKYRDRVLMDLLSVLRNHKYEKYRGISGKHDDSLVFPVYLSEVLQVVANFMQGKKDKN